MKERNVSSMIAVMLLSAVLVSACGKISLPTLLVIDPSENNKMTIQLPASFGNETVTSKVVGNMKTTVILDTNKLFTVKGTPATVRVDSFLTAGTSMDLGAISTGTQCSYIPPGEQAGGIAYLDPLITQRATFQLTIPTETKSADPGIQKLLRPIPLLLETDAKTKITLTSMINLLLNGTGLNIHQVVNTTIPANIPLLGGSAVTLDTTLRSTKTPVTDPLLDECENLMIDPAHYVAVADDGVKVQIMRYRPTLNDEFRIGKQPVIILNGINANLSFFTVHTPAEQQSSYSKMTLPSAIADWAIARDANGNLVYDTQGRPVWERHLIVDPIKYYSLAFYLWLKGYDAWFANYRNTGRGTYRTESGVIHNGTIASLDNWIALDAPAVIAKVNSVTGMKPVIGGHSTGAFCSLGYLEGAYMDYGGAADKAAAYKAAYDAGYLPHVKGDAALALARNSSIKGLILLDPAGQPPMPSYLNVPLLWTILATKMYLSLDELADSMMMYTPSDTLISLTDVIFKGMAQLDDLFVKYGVSDNLLHYFDFWDVTDTDRYVEDFTARYAMASTSLKAYAQYADNGLHKVVRECYQNGAENKDLVEPPVPNPGNDGYYYYSENVSKITAPTIAILSDAGALVDPSIVIPTIMAKKTPHPSDEIHIIQGTAHADLVVGLKSPTEVFPLIGAFLEKVGGP